MTIFKGNFNSDLEAGSPRLCSPNGLDSGEALMADIPTMAEWLWEAKVT